MQSLRNVMLPTFKAGVASMPMELTRQTDQSDKWHNKLWEARCSFCLNVVCGVRKQLLKQKSCGCQSNRGHAVPFPINWMIEQYKSGHTAKMITQDLAADDWQLYWQWALGKEYRPSVRVVSTVLRREGCPMRQHNDRLFRKYIELAIAERPDLNNTQLARYIHGKWSAKVSVIYVSLVRRRHGIFAAHPRWVDYTGQTINGLHVLRERGVDEESKLILWECVCLVCGGIHVVKSNTLHEKQNRCQFSLDMRQRNLDRYKFGVK